MWSCNVSAPALIPLRQLGTTEWCTRSLKQTKIVSYNLQVRAIAPHGKYESIFKKIVFTIYSCAKISPIILPRYM